MASAIRGAVTIYCKGYEGYIVGYTLASYSARPGDEMAEVISEHLNLNTKHMNVHEVGI